LEGNRSLIFAQPAARKKLFQTKAERLAVSIPPVDGEAAYVDPIASNELLHDC
jgi:hypothetical protein